MVVQVVDSQEMVVALLRVLNGTAEEVGEPLERVLVHGVDDGQLDNGEEEELSAVCDRAEVLTRLVDLPLSDCGLGLAHLDIV